MKELIGKEVSGLMVNAGESILVFTHPDGTRTGYETYGDCCSETWFADINGVVNLLGQVVNAAEEVKLPEIDDGRSRQEEDEFYGIKLTTDKGYTDIVFRNSSNGYYGGYIRYLKKIPSGDYKYIIENDWQA